MGAFKWDESKDQKMKERHAEAVRNLDLIRHSGDLDLMTAISCAISEAIAEYGGKAPEVRGVPEIDLTGR